MFSGQTLYSRGDKASLAVMDKQIYRLIGKATTLAAYVSRFLCDPNVFNTSCLKGWRIASVKVGILLPRQPV
jgi:hypothetical protein